jgi:hypothetical protein
VRIEDPKSRWAALTRGGARTDLGDSARPATYSRRDPHFAPMTNGTISLLTCDRDNKYWLAWMEATMPSSITQLVIGIAAAIGMAAVSVGAIGNDTAAQSTVEQTQASPKGGLTKRYETRSSELDFRLGDHQQLKRILLDGSRDRLR